MQTLELIFCIRDAHALFCIGYSNDIWQNPMSQRPRAGADYVFDHIGIKKTMEQIVAAARRPHGCGTGWYRKTGGCSHYHIDLNAGDILMNDKRFICSIGGSCSPERDFPKYLDWYALGTSLC